MYFKSPFPSQALQYIFQVFEYNGKVNGYEHYLTDAGTNNPKSQSTNNLNAPDYALTFNGIDETVTLPSDLFTSANFTTELTIEYWFKGTNLLSPVRFQDANYIVPGWVSGDNIYFIISTSGGTVGPIIGTKTELNDNKWHHVACIWKKSATFVTYVDGILKGQTTASSTNLPAISTGWLGSFSGTAEFLNGSLDEVRIWNVARTADQIRGTMCKNLEGTESNLIAHYKMSDGGGGLLTDSKSSYIATLNNNMDNANWVTSGIPVGNVSAYDYDTPTSLNLASSDGDGIIINSFSGSPSGLQIYRIDSAPNVTTAPGNITQLSTEHYFGVFLAGGTTPTYTLTYNYDGHPGISDESSLDLAKRNDYSSDNWTETNATLNQEANTLTLVGQTGGEYIFGSESSNALPVELTSFTAGLIEEGIKLNWETATEVNNYGFEIQRSAFGDQISEFETIGFVEGHGNSNSPKEYSFVDDLTDVSADSVEYHLKQIDTDGNYTYYSETAKVVFGVTGVNDEILPKEFLLSQNYPNPFNPSTTIKYSIPVNIKSEMSEVKLMVYDILGNEVATLVNERQKSGNYEVKFNASNLASGIYLYKLQSGSFVSVKKLMLMK